MNMINREVFLNDPVKTNIPNDGVTQVVEPESDQQWAVLRHELQTFVCEGEYRKGLDRILSTFIGNLGEPVQPAVWISGFYGSGKSHLARVLEFLWRNVTFPDGAAARGLVNLPPAITEHLQELTVVGRREGGLWSAAGILGAGAGDSVRLAFLGVIFRSAKLPSQYPAARFSIWMKQNGCYEAVKRGVESAGKDFAVELRSMYVSTPLASSLLAALPGYAENEKAARNLLRIQYPPVTDISDDDMVAVLGEVLALQSTTPGKIPCTLIVLDELQQYIGGNANRTLTVQLLVEACSKQFQSRILFVATGQSALAANTDLSKLQGRFTVQVALSDSDVEKVVREVVLRKAPDKAGAIQDVLESCSGEIDRHLSGAKIGPTAADRAVWVSDYPLLPVRRRFWERVLRAVDRAGAAGQLRNQLRIVHEANRHVAEEPLGTVVGGDFIYRQLIPSMLQSGILLQEIEVIIKGQNDKTADGVLRERLCAAIFLIGQLPADPGVDTGIRATVDTLADLLVQDLSRDGASLRQRIPGLLQGLAKDGALIQVGDEYRLQTREWMEWEQDRRGRFARISADDGRIASDRKQELRNACDRALKGSTFTQGTSKVPRKIELHFGGEEPKTEAGGVPVWIRDEWSASEKTVREDAQAAGSEGPIVYLFLPQTGTADALKESLAALAAATETLQARPAPSTREGDEAKSGMLTRQAEARRQVDTMVARILQDARVFQGGGSDVPGDDLKGMVQSAAQASLVRLYPDFNLGDDSKWSLVGQRARQGNRDALELLGYTGDADKHPVCVQVLAAVGAAGKKGIEIRKRFTGAPFGWSQDVVDGAILVLSACEHLRAAQNSIPVGVKGLDQSKIGQAEFRADVPITLPVRMGVRALFQEAGISYKHNEEVQSIPAYLEALLTLANAAGGDAPMPLRPSTAHIQDLKASVGNDQLAAVYEQRDRLSGEFKEWRTLKQAAESRLPRWKDLLRMLKAAEKLPIYTQAASQVEAIRLNRTLLSEPDPTPPLRTQLSDELRKAVKGAREGFVQARTAALPGLLNSDAWNKLDASARQAIQERHGLQPEPDLKVGAESELLASLESHPLALWKERTNALPQTIAQALLEAEKLTEPKAVHVTLPTASLKTAQDVDQYLQKARELLLKHIEAGNPVVL